MPSTSYHAEDVGKILLEVQNNLRALRSDLSATSTSEASATKKISLLQQLIDKAENDIKLKTEVVLNNAFNEQYTTLPAIRDTKRSRSTSRPNSASLRRLSVKEQMQSKRQMDLIMQPNSSEARNFLQERFGVAAPPPPKPRQPKKVPGSVIRSKTSEPGTVLPAAVRRDPSAPPPRLTQKDIHKGMSELVNKGLIPKYVDLTPAFVRTPAPVLCGPVQMHPWDEQFVRQEPYTNPTGFSLAGVKMDMISSARQVDLNTLPRSTASMRSKPHKSMSVQMEVGEQEESKVRKVSVAIAPAGEEGGDEDLPEMGGGRDKKEGGGTPRDYNTLLDEFSLHQFIIRRGLTLSSTPEFESYKRKHTVMWGAIQDIISRLERFLGNYNVPLAYVDGNKVALLAQLDYKEPSNDDLLDCLVNLEQVLELVKLPGGRYRGSDKERSASLVLQSVYRGHFCRKQFRQSLHRYKSCCIIQRQWRTIITFRRATKLIEEKIEDRKTQFQQLSIKLQQQWQDMSRRKRVVVHVPSISREEAQRMSVQDFAIRQNNQLGRLTWSSSPDVEVIYVAPFPLSPDVVQYYSKLLQVRGTESADDRFKIVFPENYDRFPSHFSISSILLYSPRCLKRIINFAKGKDAYIIPGVVGPEDLKLACCLNMPLLSPEPQVATVYSSKSGSRRIFSIAEVNSPPGAYDLYSTEETLHALARLIFERLDVQRWLFKIDDEFGGRGHAWLETSALQSHAALLRERERSLNLWMDPQKQQAALRKVVEELEQILPKRAQIAHKDIYPTWEAYEETFTRVGGTIEAAAGGQVDSPCVNLFILPTGEVSIHSTHDHLFTQDYHYMGAIFPQQTANKKALNAAATAIGKVCADKGIIGYISVDFVAFRDEEGYPRLWAVDLNIGMHDTAVSFELFRFLTGGNFNPLLGEFMADVEGENMEESSEINMEGQRRCYAVCDPLYHPNIANVQYNVFFNLCRLKGIHFDLEEKVGTAFMLVDSFAAGFLALLCVGSKASSALKMISEVRIDARTRKEVRKSVRNNTRRTTEIKKRSRRRKMG
uniref:IQCH-like ATP-grasp domain-containing protein n=1 Tax=Guillardia theta TaxID=55529 RepID=A0A7S4HAW2_GUITH|mmetsp:Transcript_12523/g.43566  ORF Transcript_12523/g.43566 Transcript_12523/m.43566 type:complete len:1050 (+) Transcript_12523:212-3361(+)